MEIKAKPARTVKEILEETPLTKAMEAINTARARIESGGTGEGISGALRRDDDLKKLDKLQKALAEEDLKLRP